MQDTSYANPYTVAAAQPTERTAFIRRTYLHVAGAIGAFALLEYFFFQQQWAINLATKMISSNISWMITLGLWMGISWLADSWARSDTSRGMQYAGLALYSVGNALLFMPLLLMAGAASGDMSIIANAGYATIGIFAALTAVAFLTGKDFSFLRGFLVVGGLVAMGIIVCSLIFGFSLGIIFSGAMVLFASIAILYKTSNVIHHYRTDQHVAAALALFASLALLFWYVLRIFMSRR